MRIPLTKYGLRELVALTLIFGGLAVLAAVAFWPLALLPGLLWVYVLAFFRDPPRRAQEEGAFVSPADGKVVDITNLDEGVLGTPAVRVGVFMNLFSVHVNRCPCPATVVSIEHHDGGYVDIRRSEAFDTNESSLLKLTGHLGGREFPLAVRQIAGLIARRIVTAVEPGQSLQSGQRIGMIKFGSRCELIVPRDVVGEVAVRVGQNVYGGRTVLIRPKKNA